MLILLYIFEKRAANLIRVHKIVPSELKSAFGFQQQTLRKQPLFKRVIEYGKLRRTMYL